MIVPIPNLVFMALSGIICILLPIAISIIWKRKTKCSILPFIYGALTFLIFTQLFEALLHYFCLVKENIVSIKINSNPYLYMLYGAFSAGIFEECGRYLMFKTVLRKSNDWKDSISSALGHGGIESVLISAATLLLNFVIAILNNTNNTNALLSLVKGNKETLDLVLHSLENYTIGFCLLSVLERIIAITLHISLSIIVFKSKMENKLRYLLLAIFLHAIFDMPVALMQKGVIKSTLLVELYLMVVAILVSLFSFRIYKSEINKIRKISFYY